MELTKSFRFEASHVLPKHPGKCSRLHGHSWVLHVSVSGPINPHTGFVMDFAEVSERWKRWIEQNLDHRHLGTSYQGFEPEAVPFQVPQMWQIPYEYRTLTYPTSENILMWLAAIFKDFPWSTLSLEETCTSRATLTRSEYEGQIQVEYDVPDIPF